MKHSLVLLYFSLAFSFILNAQKSKTFKFNQKSSKNVVNSIFQAAKSGTFDYLYTLCDPNGYSDRDVKRICFITQLADTIEGTDASESAKQNLAEFVTIFKSGKITGDVAYEKDGNTEYAKVPIWYDHPQGENRSHETITLVKRSDKWYLFSF